MKLLKIDKVAHVELTLEEVELLKNGLFYLIHSTRSVFDTDRVHDLGNSLKSIEKDIRRLNEDCKDETVDDGVYKD